jgi:hypothetical protein
MAEPIGLWIGDWAGKECLGESQLFVMWMAISIVARLRDARGCTVLCTLNVLHCRTSFKIAVTILLSLGYVDQQ